MVNLNNRLAAYIEKIRSLETENHKLQVQVQAFEETSSREVTNVKEMYENELKEARNLLDEVAKEKAQLQVENNAARESADAEKTRADGLAHDVSVLEGKLKDAQKRLRAKENQAINALKERDDAVDQLNALKSKVKDLTQDLESSKSLIEVETLKRVEFENKVQSLSEDLQFKEKLWKEEIRESRKRHEISVTEIDEKVQRDYESRLEIAILDLREQQNYEIEQMRDELEIQYKAKINASKGNADTTRKALMQVQEESKTYRLKVDRLQSSVTALERENGKLSARVKDLDLQLETAGEMRRAAIHVLEQERDELRVRLETIESEYNELLNLKLQLDLEISTYRKLLEEEEARLNITPSRVASDSKVRTRAVRKRKRGVQDQQEVSHKHKKQDATITAVRTETITTEQTTCQKRTIEGTPSGDHEKSCAIM